MQRSATFWKKSAEQEGLAPPSRLGRLRGHKSERGQLRDQRLVAADVEIARQQGRPTHQAELIHDEGPLAATDLAARVEREDGEPVRVEQMGIPARPVRTRRSGSGRSAFWFFRYTRTRPAATAVRRGPSGRAAYASGSPNRCRTAAPAGRTLSRKNSHHTRSTPPGCGYSWGRFDLPAAGAGLLNLLQKIRSGRCP